MRSPFCKIAAGLLLGLLLASCASTAKFIYPDKTELIPEASSIPPSVQKVAVLPFEDFRSDDNTTATMSLYYVPLCPYGYVECERPETGSRFTTVESFAFTPSEDLAKAAASSLRRSHLFSDAFFTFGGDSSNADLILEGKVLSTYYKGRMFSYGVSIYSCYLWILGAPYGTSLNRLSVQLTLKSKSGRTLWEFTSTHEDYLVQWMYARRGQDMKFYSSLMRQTMTEAITDLSLKLKANPNLLKPNP